MTDETNISRLLIAGASGRLGRLLRQYWSRRPIQDMTPVYLSRSGADDLKWSPGASLPPCRTVIALWGRTSGTKKDLAENIELAQDSLKLAHQSGADRVFHFSSAGIYGPGLNMAEDSIPTPVTDYGRSKLSMEETVRQFPDDGIVHCCLRLANVVGADSLAPALRRSSPVALDRFPDGRGPLRSYICPGDLARVLAALAMRPARALPAVLNVSAPAPVGMEQLAIAAGKEISWQQAADHAVQTVSLDSTRLSHLLPDVELHTTPQGMINDWFDLEEENDAV